MTAGKLALLLAGASFAAIALAEKSRKQVILDEAQDALDALPRGYTADQLAAEQLSTVGAAQRSVGKLRAADARSTDTFLLVGGAAVVAALVLRR